VRKLIDEPRQLVVTVHGIRTFGGWQEGLEDLVNDAVAPGSVEFCNYKFGYFSVIGFIIPLSRWLVTRRFRKTLLKLTGKRSWARIDLVGHSFGTHLIAWSLRGLRTAPRGPCIHTIILAGSVLRSEFPWDELLRSSVKRVVNDCGGRDNVLMLSQFGVLFTGMAGRIGFVGATGPKLRNRYSMFGHSGYFLDEHGKADTSYMKMNWLPLLTSDAETPKFDHRPATAREGLITWVAANAEPIKLLFYMTPIILAFLWILGLYQNAETERNKALAGKLYAEAQLLLDQDAANLDLSALLALEADRLATNPQIERLIRRVSYLLPQRQITIEKKHSYFFESAWLDSQEETLATVNYTGEVEKWSLKDGQRLPGSLPSLAQADQSTIFGGTQVSPDRRFIVRPGDQGTVDVYDLRTLELFTRLSPNMKPPFAIALSYAANYLTIAAADGKIAVWHLIDGSSDSPQALSLDTLTQVPDFDFRVLNIAISSDGKLAAFSANMGGESNPFETWIVDLEAGRLIKRIPHPSLVSAIAFDPSGRRIATASDNLVFLTYVRDDAASIQIQTGALTKTVAFSPDGQAIVTTNSSRVARVWNARTGEELAAGIGAQSISDASFDATGDRLVVAGDSADDSGLHPYAAVFRLAAADGFLRAKLQVPFGTSGFDASVDGKYIAVDQMMRGEGIRLFDISNGHEIWRSAGREDAMPRFSRDGSLVSYLSSGRWETKRVRDNSLVHVATDFSPPHTRRERSRFGDVYASYHTEVSSNNGYNSGIDVFRTGEKAPLVKRSYSLAIDAVAISPSGRYVAAVLSSEGSDKYDNLDQSKVLLIDTKQDQHDVFLDYSGLAQALAFDESEAKLAATGRAGTIVWSIPDQKKKQEILIGGVGETVALSSDGKLIAILDTDNTITVHELESGKILAQEHVPLKSGGESRLLFTANDTRVVGGFIGANSPVIVQWNLHHVRDRICQRLADNLTIEEWSQYLSGQDYRKTCGDIDFRQ